MTSPANCGACHFVRSGAARCESFTRACVTCAPPRAAKASSPAEQGAAILRRVTAKPPGTIFSNEASSGHLRAWTGIRWSTQVLPRAYGRLTATAIVRTGQAACHWHGREIMRLALHRISSIKSTSSFMGQGGRRHACRLGLCPPGTPLRGAASADFSAGCSRRPLYRLWRPAFWFDRCRGGSLRPTGSMASSSAAADVYGKPEAICHAAILIIALNCLAAKSPPVAAGRGCHST